MGENLEDYPFLIGQAGSLKGQRWPLNRTVILGREPSCEVVIPDRRVSHFHARLTPTPEGVILEDMGSKNGTHCNGHPVGKPIVLKDGDMVQIALAQQFIFMASDSTMPLTDTLRQPNKLRIDLRSRRVWVSQEQVDPPLSALQFHILKVLYEGEGQVVDRQDLVAAVWGEDVASGVSDQALDAIIRRLRDRLASIDPAHQYIVTVRGHGIRLDNPPTD